MISALFQPHLTFYIGCNVLALHFYGLNKDKTLWLRLCCAVFVVLLLYHWKKISQILMFFNKRIPEKPLKCSSVSSFHNRFGILETRPQIPVQRTGHSSKVGWGWACSYTCGFSTPWILQERRLSVCYKLIGRDGRSKAAMQINYLSVLQWERRQEIRIEHNNHMAAPHKGGEDGGVGCVEHFWWEKQQLKKKGPWNFTDS